jgi:hypothetical protein
MSWAMYAKEALCRGETVSIRPREHSMTGNVNHGDLVTPAPCDPDTLRVGDIVLVRVHKAIKQGRFLIGNNRGGTNGWVGKQAIYGIAIQVER